MGLRAPQDYPLGALMKSDVPWTYHLLIINFLTNIVRSDLQDMVNPMRKRCDCLPP